MSYCPNCGCELEQAASVCQNCNASFGPGSAWKPVAEPPPQSNFIRVGESGDKLAVQDYGRTELEIGIDRAAALSQLGIRCTAVAGICIGYILLNPERVVREKTFFAVTMSIVAVLIAYSWMRILKSRVAFTITDRGIVPAFADFDFLAWDEIVDVELVDRARTPLIGEAITVKIRNVEAVLGRQSAWRRSVLERYLKDKAYWWWRWGSFFDRYATTREEFGSWGGRIPIPTKIAEGGAERLLKIIRERIRPA
jgi:hypothetical protein